MDTFALVLVLFLFVIAGLIIGSAIVIARRDARRLAESAKLDNMGWRRHVTTPTTTYARKRQSHVPPRPLPPRAPPMAQQATKSGLQATPQRAASDWTSVDVGSVASSFSDSGASSVTFRSGGGSSGGAGSSSAWNSCGHDSSSSSSSSSSDSGGSSSCGGT